VNNMKPADEFLMVKQKIKELKEREAQLRDGFLSGEFSQSGDFAAVKAAEQSRKNFDRKAAESAVGDLSRFDIQTTSIVVRVEELQQPEAA